MSDAITDAAVHRIVQVLRQTVEAIKANAPPEFLELDDCDRAEVYRRGWRAACDHLLEELRG